VTRFRWWLGKELREHRVVLLLLALAIPLGSWLAVHVTRGRPMTPDQLRASQATPEKVEQWTAGPFPHTWHRERWEGLLLIGLGLVVVCLAGGLFAAESRRGTTALMARSPRAWRTAFGAKIVFLAIVVAVMFVGHAFVLRRLADAYSLVEYWEDGARDTSAFLWPVRFWPWIGFFLVVAAWMLVASTSLSWVGIPAVVGAAVAVSTAVPAILWHDKLPYFFRWWLGGIGVPMLVSAAAALLLATWAWFRSVRFSRSALSLGLRLFAATVALTAIGTGVTAASVSTYRDFDASVPDLRFTNVTVGVGGRFLFVQAYRGDPWGSEDPDPFRRERVGTPWVPWKIDLSTGAWEAAGGPSESWSRSEHEPWRMGPPQALITLQDDDEDATTGAWFDTRTGERLPERRIDVPPASAVERMRASYRETTRVRDSQGRPAWLIFGRIERDGAEPVQVAHAQWALRYVLEVEGGWYLPDVPNSGLELREYAGTRDADDGRKHLLPYGYLASKNFQQVGWWDARHLLAVRTGSDPVPPGWAARPPFLAALQLVDLDAQEHRPLALDLPEHLALAVPLARVRADELLVRLGEPGALRLARIAVGAETEERPVAGSERLLADVEAMFVLPWNARNRPPVEGPDSVLLALYRSDPPGHAVRALGPIAGSGAPAISGTERLLEAWAVYETSTASVRLVRPWAPNERDAPLDVSTDGSVLVLEANRRIVQLGPEAGRREVLFPRR
jgi:hypothetical protein